MKNKQQYQNRYNWRDYKHVRSYFAGKRINWEIDTRYDHEHVEILVVPHHILQKGNKVERNTRTLTQEIPPALTTWMLVDEESRKIIEADRLTYLNHIVIPETPTNSERVKYKYKRMNKKLDLTLTALGRAMHIHQVGGGVNP